MKISDFDYFLPDERIALYPPKTRGESRLLTLNHNTGEIQHKNYSDLSELLNEGDVLVLNNTKVIRARIEAKKSTGGKIEIILLEEHGDSKSHDTFMYHGKLKIGDEIRVSNGLQTYTIVVTDILGNGLAKGESEIDLYKISEEIGQVPIPPYLNRSEEEIDKERYQTVFAKNEGSVAAPTASLNFTEELKAKLESKGVRICFLTLHVGLGTFLPIRSDEVEEHKMHSEFYRISVETIDEINKAKSQKKRVVSLGTTVARTLEHAAFKLLEVSNLDEITGEADIFIYPGYEFKVVDALLTNFHAPRSTVLMLAGAFAGWENLKNAYEVAIKEKYNFLSYGDSMFIC